MLDVAIATSAEHPDLPPQEKSLLPALARRGIEARVVVWDDPAFDPAAARMTLVRSTWDYTGRLDEFLAWAERAAAVAPLWNPARVVAWNARKDVYLRELGERGVPTIDTEWLPAGSEADLAAILAGRGWKEAVVKPAVDAAARGATRARMGDEAAAQRHLDARLPTVPMMVQPFVPEIQSLGETSLVYLNGALSHAVRKVPAPGDYRVQAQYGAATREVEPTAAEREVAALAMARVPGETLYARVDLVTPADGGPRVIELELIEPVLFYDQAPGAADRMAGAVEARLREAGGARRG